MIKLAFTTLGCPQWKLDTILRNAEKMGFDGVDFRGYLAEMNIYRCPEFSSDAGATARRFRDAGIEVPCFSSSARAFNPKEEDRIKSLDEIKRYLDLCHLFGSRYIRVFGGHVGETKRSAAVGAAAAHLKEMGRLAKECGVTILLETHDDFIASEHVLELMEETASEQVAALWDIHHPYRFFGEKPGRVWDNLGKWIRYTHWKDSKLKPDSREYQLCLPGKGDIPLKETFECLVNGGYKGYFTLEWEKKWHPEIEEPEVVFPAFVKMMRRLEEGA